MDLNWKRTVGLVFLVAGIIIASLGLVSAFSLATLTVVVEDETTDGIVGAQVYYFDGGGGIEPPENGTLIGLTDGSGRVYVELNGFFRFGIIADGYVCSLEQPQHNPSEAWRDTWTAWGAAGSLAGTYTFVLVEGTVSVVPDPVKPDPVDPGNMGGNGDDIIWDDPSTVEIAENSVPWTLIIGVGVACLCVPFFAWDKLEGK